jgi:Mg2+ and Co2+ transporter CorA
MNHFNSLDEEHDYKELVKLTARGIPTFKPLHQFLLDGNDNLNCEITLLTLHENGGSENQASEGCPETSKNFKSQVIDSKDEEHLVKVLKQTGGHQLLLVENLTPSVTSLLGTHWKVPPDFFLAHLENSNWYRMQNIPENLPGLSSVQSLDGFVRFQFVGPREIEIEDSMRSQSGGKVCPHSRPFSSLTQSSPATSISESLLADRIHEDPATASVPRVAGGFNPWCRDHPLDLDPEDGPYTKANPVAFVRNSVTLWFNKDGDEWRKGLLEYTTSCQRSILTCTGIVLFDPPFVAKNPRYKNKNNSVYRSFLRRKAPPCFSADDIDNRKSYKLSFEKCLQQNQHVKDAGVRRPFVLLEDVCRIIASEWLVFNTYIERELNNIDASLEIRTEEKDHQKLQDLLQHLMRARRRVTKYESLVNDQLHLCPEHWKHESHSDPDSTSSMACPVAHPTTSAKSPLRDFDQVRDHLTHNKTRISQAIKIVMSLMNVHLNNLVVEQNRALLEHNDLTTKQNQLSEARNSSLAVLTGVTSFLLPFTTVAAFMAIPPESGLGPGSKGQWIYWVSAGMLALTLMLAFRFDFMLEKRKLTSKEENRKIAQGKGSRQSTSKDEAPPLLPEIKLANLGGTRSSALVQILRRGASKKGLDIPEV